MSLNSTDSSVLVCTILPFLVQPCIQKRMYWYVPVCTTLYCLVPGVQDSRCESSQSGILYTWHKRVHTCLYCVYDRYVLCYSMYVSYTPYRHVHTFLKMYEHVHTFWNNYKHVCTLYVHVHKYSGINMYVHRSDMYVHVFTSMNEF